MDLATPTQASVTEAAAQAQAAAARRAGWRHQVTLWHWVSSAMALVGMLLFAVTGITLNHAGLLESAAATITQRSAELPETLRAALDAQADDAGDALPPALHDWLAQHWQLAIYPKAVERNADEIFIDLKRPGVDASISIERRSGRITHEAADRGWVAWLNELHRGRNAGPVWHAFISVFGVACVVFCVTGLLLLQLHARGRWLVWPLSALGFVLPLLLVLLFVH